MGLYSRSIIRLLAQGRCCRQDEGSDARGCVSAETSPPCLAVVTQAAQGHVQGRYNEDLYGSAFACLDLQESKLGNSWSMPEASP
ncbi:hypothetical protein E5288_WYG022411 [Bos mutus]|uniref:Uncharacterized protein n=1 Tax=Bos mutus TaxID=72004 RepID=A0A6B0RXT9_9CETA|nr:hypothetical protein [Bos mutus]